MKQHQSHLRPDGTTFPPVTPDPPPPPGYVDPLEALEVGGPEGRADAATSRGRTAYDSSDGDAAGGA